MGTDWIECLDKRPTDRTGHDLVIIIGEYFIETSRNPITTVEPRYNGATYVFLFNYLHF